MTKVLEVRQTTASPASSKTFPTPTVKIALTSAFTGPSICAQNLLTMLPPPSYQIWANEPVPVENNTVAGCFPTEFLQSYSFVAITMGSSIVPSSIVPAMSPFACPKDYCTALASAKNYIVCCPTGYQFHPPDRTVDSARPFYGGTCYSDMTSGSSYPVLQYNTNGDTASTLFPATVSGVQAYAHPIDGFAMTSPTALGCSSSANSSSQTSSAATSSSTAAAVSTGVSGGVIAGAVIGSLLGLAAIVGLVFYLLAYRRKRNDAPAPQQIHHMSDEYTSEKGGDELYRHEANASFTHAELGTPERGLGVEQGGSPWGAAAMNDGHGAFEMSAEQPIEMDAAADKKTGYSDRRGLVEAPAAAVANRGSVAKVLDKHDRERMRRMESWRDN